MKNTKTLAILGVVMLSLLSARPQPAPEETQAPASAPASLPPTASEVVRLSEAGSTEDVLVAYIQRSTYPFNLSADQILYLRDIGISSPVITAMLNRDHELQTQGQAYTYDQKVYPPANPTAVAPQPISAPEPQPAIATPPAEAPLTPPPATAAPVYVSSPPPDVTYFYNDLSPYGTWVELEGVGWCWQPRVVVINRAWRPYCDSGYWVYSDAGWYWQSSYSWGWAPFHYGRWHLHPRCGWVWLPDRVWGPSWVVWRSESDHCGWAPLPPHSEFVAGVGWRFNGVSVSVGFDFGLHSDHFTFVALSDFNHHDLDHRRLAPTQVTRIYNHTTIINNYTVVNKTVVNEGIKVDRVAAATHTQIHKVPIHDAPAGVTRTTRTAAAPVGTKSNPVIYRPQLKAPTARPATMVAQKVDNRHPIIQPAPVVTAKAERPANRSPYPSSAAPRSTQPQDNRNLSQPAPDKAKERPAPSHNNYSSAPSSPSPAPANRNSTQNAPRPAPTDDSKPNGKGPQSQTAAPPGTRPGAYDYKSHFYYPKGYHQAAEVHSLPPLNPRPAAPDSQPDRGNSQHHKNPESGKQNR
ncbi:MAG TPA: DUF6600 domain-containing protein [Candidatus Limnocylindrales bacterium]|jgi:hypothetical protein|nr:DUF6600 domain-containing protein [Candidatus Limnocylindrales bacterium]